MLIENKVKKPVGTALRTPTLKFYAYRWSPDQRLGLRW